MRFLRSRAGSEAGEREAPERGEKGHRVQRARGKEGREGEANGGGLLLEALLPG